jgi:hypothetical protein
MRTDGNCSHISTLRTRTEIVLETLVSSPFNHLTRLVARENFIIFSRRESSRSYNIKIDLKEIRRERLNWNHLVEDTDKRRFLVITAMNLSINGGEIID